MSDVLRPMQLSVEKDLSGGIKVGFGGSVGLLTPDQAFEFAMVLLRAAGVETEFGANFPAVKQKHFRAG